MTAMMSTCFKWLMRARICIRFNITFIMLFPVYWFYIFYMHGVFSYHLSLSFVFVCCCCTYIQVQVIYIYIACRNILKLHYHDCKGYIHSSCYWNHQIVSINLTHQHFFRGCVPEMFVTSYLIMIIVQTYRKTLNLYNACQIYFVECVNKIKPIFSVIH